jgi:hypothetical protein
LHPQKRSTGAVAQARGRVENATERAVLDREDFDILDKALHEILLKWPAVTAAAVEFSLTFARDWREIGTSR